MPPSLAILNADEALENKELPVSLPSPDGYAALSDSYLSPGRDSPTHPDGEACRHPSTYLVGNSSSYIAR